MPTSSMSHAPQAQAPRHNAFTTVTRLLMRGQRFAKLREVTKWIYTCIKDICGEVGGACWYNYRSLAKIFHSSISTLSRHIPLLEQAGLITVKRQKSPQTGHELLQITIVDIDEENRQTYCTCKECFKMRQSQNETDNSVSNCDTFVSDCNNSVSNCNKDLGLDAQHCFNLNALRRREEESNKKEKEGNGEPPLPSHEQGYQGPTIGANAPTQSTSINYGEYGLLFSDMAIDCTPFAMSDLTMLEALEQETLTMVQPSYSPSLSEEASSSQGEWLQEDEIALQANPDRSGPSQAASETSPSQKAAWAAPKAQEGPSQSKGPVQVALEGLATKVIRGSAPKDDTAKETYQPRKYKNALEERKAQIWALYGELLGIEPILSGDEKDGLATFAMATGATVETITETYKRVKKDVFWGPQCTLKIMAKFHNDVAATMHRASQLPQSTPTSTPATPTRRRRHFSEEDAQQQQGVQV